MSKTRLFVNAFAFLAFTLAISSAAQAQATRTWVSGVGDDVNPCSRTAPCKTFAGAISKTAANGEINAIDPGGYGTVTITKSITIDGQGTMASILAAGTNGVIVNDSQSGAPNTIIVVLRNLSIHGAGTGFDGVRFLSGRRLLVEDCQIFGFRGNGLNSDGIEVAPSTGTNFNLVVKNTSIHDNTGDGIRQTTSIGTLNASYDNLLLSNNNNGLNATGGTGNISNSVIDGSAGSGITASNGAIINAVDNRVTSNGTGINCASPSSVRISRNSVTRNTTGVAGNGTIQSFGNNEVIGNTTDVAFGTTISSVSGTNFR
ncbi:MAG TPA: hypothetical protein VEY09_19405 [Pyrinomonadaceae bacterium]|nr:hypothetical protein [Pyrinomonadaceae bacterium]